MSARASPALPKESRINPPACTWQRRRMPLAIIAVVLFSAASPAQRIAIRGYTLADGLPSAQVESIAQDGDGTMWFLTRLGIASYDGASWRVKGYPNVSPQRLSYMSADTRGGLWVYSGERCWRRAGAGWWELPPPPVGSSRIVQAVCVGDGEALRLVAGDGRGLMHVFDGMSWSTVEVASGGGSSLIRGLTVMGTRCLIGTSRGVVAFDPVTGTVEPWALELPSRSVGRG